MHVFFFIGGREVGFVLKGYRVDVEFGGQIDHIGQIGEVFGGDDGVDEKTNIGGVFFQEDQILNDAIVFCDSGEFFMNRLGSMERNDSIGQPGTRYVQELRVIGGNQVCIDTDFELPTGYFFDNINAVFSNERLSAGQVKADAARGDGIDQGGNFVERQFILAGMWRGETKGATAIASIGEFQGYIEQGMASSRWGTIIYGQRAQCLYKPKRIKCVHPG